MKKIILIFCSLLGFLLYNTVNAQINYKWAKRIGSANSDVGKSIAVDASGNVYVTGRFSGLADFDPSQATYNLTIPGYTDCFFAKYNSIGNLIWAKHLELASGTNYSYGLGIAVDGASNVYITGFFDGTVDFNPSTGATANLTSHGVWDVFVAKYDASGNYVWANNMGVTGGYAAGTAIALDGGPGATAPNVYITGTFDGTVDFDPSNATTDLTSNGLHDIFFAKFIANGALIMARSLGGPLDDGGLGIAVNANEEAYLTGSFEGLVNFNPGGSPFNIPALGLRDVFYMKYDVNGHYVWAKNIGSTGGIAENIGHAITMDSNDNIYLTGSFQGTATFDSTNGVKKVATGQKDIFFSKHDAHNGDLKWANSIGSITNTAIDSSSGTGIVVDPSGNVYITGYFNGSADFDPGAGTTEVDTLTARAKGDLFFAKYDSAGTHIWAKNVCSDSLAISYGIALDSVQSIYLTGSFKNITNFDPGYGTANLSPVGNEDIFFAKYRQGTSIISGKVTQKEITNGSISAVDSGEVKLFTYVSNTGALHLEDVTSISIGGAYSFNYVPADSFIVFAIPTHADSLLAPTFSYSTTHWNWAHRILITSQGTYDTTENILIIKDTVLTGTATIGGEIYEGLCFGCPRNVGDPINGIPVGLEHDPGGIIATTFSALNNAIPPRAMYTFKNLRPGNYKLKVTIPGLPQDSTYKISVPPGTFIKLDYNFVADSNSIDTIAGTPNSVLQTASAIESKIRLYPNPHKGFTSIEFTMLEANVVQLDVYNLLGEKVAEVFNEKKQAGIVKYAFNANYSGLKAGVYLLKLKIGNEISTLKMIQLE